MAASARPVTAAPSLWARRLPALALLPNHAMRARRCPGPIAVLWAWDAALGAALAWPFVAIVRAAYGTHPRADAALWDPGALTLLDLLVRRLPELSSLVAHAAVVTLLGALLGLVPSAALLACLAFAGQGGRPPPVRAALALATTAFGPFSLLLLVTLLFQGSMVAAAAAAASLAVEGFSRTYGQSTAELVALVVLVLGAGVAALAGVVQDAARAAVVRFGLGALAAMRVAIGTVARAPGEAFWSWSWRAGASLVPVAFGSLLASKVGGRGGAALVALFVVHQLVVGARVAVRASWLSWAMRAVDRSASPRRRRK